MNSRTEKQNKWLYGRKGVFLFLFLFSILLIQPSLSVRAEPSSEGNADGDNGGAGTQTIVGGPKYTRTGWLVYVVDSSGHVRTETKVLYSSTERPPAGCRRIAVTAFGAPTNNYREDGFAFDYWLPSEPYTPAGNGNGLAIKNNILQGSKNIDIVKYLFEATNPGITEEYIGNEEEEGSTLFLVLEAFYWGQVYNGTRPTGTYICATAKGWGAYQKAMGYPEAGSILIKRYTNNVYANCVKLATSQLGKTPRSGPLTNTQMAAEDSGNGFMLFWAKDGITGTLPSDTIEGTPTFGEGGESRQLYAIQNWSDEFDIDQAIPSGETVYNKYEADSFYGNASVLRQTKSQTYSATHTYKWTEKEKHRVGFDTIAMEPIYGYKTVHKSKTVSVVFTASIAYQVLTRVQVYGMTGLTVVNGAFPQDAEYTKANSSIWADVTPKVSIYTSDYSYGNMAVRDGMTVNNAYHYSLPGTDKVSDKTFNVSGSPSDNTINSNIRAAMKSVYDASWSRNDNLVVELSNGLKYPFMEDTKVTGCIISGYSEVCAADSVHNYGGNGLILAGVKPFRNKGQLSGEIPIETDNGNYPSGVQARYHSLVNSVGSYDTIFRAGCGIFTDDPSTDNIYRHIIGGLDGTKWNRVDKPGGDGYDIKVHTPAVSPFYVTDYVGVPQTRPDEQLLDVDATADFQLKLDNWYMLRFNPDQWASYIYGEVKGYHQNVASYPSKYDKYIIKKEVKFPFDVYYDGTFYQADTWINVLEPDNWQDIWSDGISWDYDEYESNNHWQMMPFYIPSYAQEKTGIIEVKVYAQNVDGRYEGSHDVVTAMQLQKNTQQQNYIATYKNTSQLSGHIYGFTVTGVDDTEMYKGVDISQQYQDRLKYALCPEKEEKVSGIYNRFGEPDLRYQTDGTLTRFITDADGAYQPHQNLLPLREGSNDNVPGKMGDGRLWMGTAFSFDLKTIANLWGDNDYIKIVPTFKFYSKEDGSLVDSLRMEGDNIISTSNRLKILYKESGEYREFFCEQAYLPVYSTAIGDPKTRESYYTQEDALTANGTPYRYGNWPQYTLDRYNQAHMLTGDSARSYYELMDVAYPSYTSAMITLDWRHRLLSGEWEQLQKNRTRTDTSLITYFDWDSNGYLENGMTQAEILRFRDSMQTWYGGYDMPGRLYIYDDINGDYDDMPSYSPGEWVNNRYDIVINFDIIAYKNGIPHLSYGGLINGGRVWEKEGYQTQEDTYDPGDVVEYDMDYKLSDKEKVHLVNIN